MAHEITLNWVNDLYSVLPGIYKITLGGRFYIGKANIPYLRIKEHTRGINKTLRTLAERRFIKPTDAVFTKYLPIAKYLAENPSIISGTVEIIQRGIHPVSLYYMENYRLNMVKDNPDYLNTLFKSPRPAFDDYHHCDAKLVDGKILLYNPVDQSKCILATTALKEIDTLRKAMNISLDTHSYKRYLLNLRNIDYSEKVVYLSLEERNTYLKEMAAILLAP
jgi:hypothetical protein